MVQPSNLQFESWVICEIGKVDEDKVKSLESVVSQLEGQHNQRNQTRENL